MDGGATSTVAYEHLLKILLIGDMGSNKRQLLHTYVGEEDMSDTTTLGEDAPFIMTAYMSVH